MSDIVVTERGTRPSVLGPVLQLKVWTPTYRVLGWREVWEAFVTAYPGRWAVEVYPPREALIDGKAVYHLWVCDECPEGLNLHP